MDLLAIGFQYVSALMVDALKIFQSPSPNFGNRRDYVTPKMVVLHYTAMKSSDDAIARMSDPKSEVSAHYLIDKFGKIIQLVDEQKRAWHAGESSYKGVTDCNNYSIGIELEGTDDDLYTDDQYDTLIEATKGVIKNYPLINKDSIVGHSDVSPGRKTDPGSRLDWGRFLEAL